MNDVERLRLQRDSLLTLPTPKPSTSSHAFVGKVTTISPALGKFVLVTPQTVTGAEAEGGMGAFAAGAASSVAVYVVGPGTVKANDLVVCRYAEDRWVTDKTGPGGPPPPSCLPNIPSCFCSNIPPVLTMTSADENCNFKMFQSCTISYGPHPGFEALGFGANYYLSDRGFPDPIGGGATFWYVLLCQFNQFSLTRAYLTSPYGSPFRDGVLYTWLIGNYGNTCPSCSDWVVSPAYLAWAACADAFLDAHYPKPGGVPWALDVGTVDPVTACITGYGGAAFSSPSPGMVNDVINACGFLPPIIKCGDPAGTFHLDNGAAFPGSDPTCRVTIDG